MRGRRMRKIWLIALAIILFISSLPAQTETANDDYIKAMTTADPVQKANLLKEYLTKYAGKGTQYENYANANLCLLAYQGKTVDETINYGEKALALGGLDDLIKCQVLIILSGIYGERGQNLEKAKSYASQVVELAKANRNKESEEAGRTQWNRFLGAGYYAQGRAFDKAKDAKNALGPYIESYKILNNKQILNDVERVGKTLYDFKFYNEAEKAFGIVADVLKNFESYSIYARILHREGKKIEALKYYKMAYMKQKSGETAFNIGTIEAEDAKSNPAHAQEALNYFLDASFLSAAHSKKAMELAQDLFFNTLNKDLKYNEKVKEQQERSAKLEDLTKTFNEKFGEKNEEDLTEAEKKEMQNLKAQIESEKNVIQKLGDEQKLALDKWNVQIEQAKKRLGIK
jgi:hypothetical protein